MSALNSRLTFGVTTAALAVLMLVTRFKVSGDWLHLYDASMGVMFLGGLLLRHHLAFVGFLLLAVLIDVVAISASGQNFFQSHCVTPSYGFLQLSYAVLWYGARAYAPHLRPTFARIAIALAVGFVSTVVAFVISNGSFYWLGGAFQNPDWNGYIASAWQWGPSYVWVAMQYIALGLAAWVMAKQPWRRAAAQPAGVY